LLSIDRTSGYSRRWPDGPSACVDASPTGFTVTQRNDLRGSPIHKLDSHFAKDLKLVSRTKLTGIAEVFNVYKSRQLRELPLIVGSATYGTALQNNASTYLPRIWQLGFKFSF
jgi:hypothetical protein